MKRNIKSTGEITLQLSTFAHRVEEQSFTPNKEALEALKKEILAYSGTSQFAQEAVGSQKELVGTLLIQILDLEDSLWKAPALTVVN